MSNDKLAEALRRTCRKMKTFSRTGVLDGAVAVWVDEIESAIAAHAAEAAQAMTPRELAKRLERGEKWKLVAETTQLQAQSVPGELAEPIEGAFNYEQKLAFTEGWNACREAMLAAAPQQAAEPKGWMASDNTGRVIDAKAKTAGSRAAATASATAIYSIPLYTHPQPAQDAKLPSDEDFRLHLGELTSAELRVAQAAFRFAVAKESGR